ncbi:hypothetical protein CC78DRAFT_535597 [Lojkania enalia]|uniref:CFEM domain-containing protein n=1 Tax=Lojkania enalia TaxID=147567 RepID=A0A9P4K5V6_9PLEO|nr:hypothetical protein CC78DRAFT_535597 [Didymosphaeria enalia]
MRLLITLLAGAASAVAIAKPQGDVTPCRQDCWNEAAAGAGCDPNVDDACLCGIFFDLVTQCTSQVCSIEENLATIDFLTEPCQ